jgi:hypothetical protein
MSTVRVLLAWVLLACAFVASAQEPSPRLSIEELLPNPRFHDDAAGWHFNRARLVEDAGPDGLAAIELEGKEDDLEGHAYMSVAVGVAGETIEVLARSRGLADNQRLAIRVAAWAWKNDEWERTGNEAESFLLPSVAWRSCKLSFEVPADSTLVVGFYSERSEPIVVADVHVRLAGPPPADAPPDQAGSLTLTQLRELTLGWRDTAQRLRGLSFSDPPNFQVITRRRYAATVAGSMSGLPGDMVFLQEALQMLGVMGPDEHLVQSIASAVETGGHGYYFVPLNTILVAADTPMDTLPAVAIHELGHALDEQRFEYWHDYQHDDPLDLDASLVKQSLIEGAATALMDEFMREEIREGRAPADLAAKAGSTGVRGSVSKSAGSTYVRLRNWMPYSAGAVFFGAGRLDTSLESLATALNRGFEHEPRSMAQLLHPRAYWGAEEVTEPVEVLMADIAIDIGDEWSLAAEGTMGEPIVAALGGTPTPVGAFDPVSHAQASWTNVAANGWAADRWQLYQADEASVVILCIRWETEADANEFVALTGMVGRATFLRSGTLVVLAVGDEGAPTSEAAAAALKYAGR